MKTKRLEVQRLAKGFSPVVKPVARKRIGIVKLLEWAYREELIKTPREAVLRGPEAPRSGWAAVSAQGALMTEVVSDGTSSLVNRFGVVPDSTARDEPHGDALAVHDAVMALDELALGIPESWCGDAALRCGIDGVEPEEWPAAAGRALNKISRSDGGLRVSVSQIMIRAATMGKPPAWRGGEVKRRVVLQANGRPAWFVRVAVSAGVNPDGTERFTEVERDGYCAKQHRPMPGAYQRVTLDPDPADFLVERARYEVWRAALDVLCEALANVEGFMVLPSNLSWRPWLDLEAPQQRVLAGGGSSARLPQKAAVRAGAKAPHDPRWGATGPSKWANPRKEALRVDPFRGVRGL